jgi:glutathione S-transferase
MLKLYVARVCPYAHRARLTISAKEVEHEREEIDLKAMPQWYKDLSPNQSVPLLVHDDRKIWESLVVAQYLDETFEGMVLTPPDPYERAMMRVAVEAISSKLVSKLGPALHPKGQPVTLDQAAIWSNVEKSMHPEGPFWCGADVTLADFAAYPFLERWPIAEHSTGQKLELPPRLAEWLEHMREVPAVQKEMAPAEFYLQAMGVASAR